MLIKNVRAHHVRIPYDGGVASFKQGASAISAVDIVLVEISTDAGFTGWGDAFGYVCPRSTATAIEEMIAPQAQGLRVPDAAGIPAFMERIQRNLHLFGRYGITMFAISALDIALWDLAARAKGVPLYQLLGSRRRARIPAYASLLRIGDPASLSGRWEALGVYNAVQKTPIGSIRHFSHRRSGPKSKRASPERPEVRPFEIGLQPLAREDDYDPAAYATDLIRWLRLKGLTRGIRHNQMLQEYHAMCSYYEWTPHAWNSVARELTRQTTGKKVFGRFVLRDGSVRRLRIYPIDTPH